MKCYPINEGERRESEVRITDIFDRESIDIDKLVYLALHYRAITIWIERDRFEEERIMISYLIEAYEMFSSKCEKKVLVLLMNMIASISFTIEARSGLKNLKN